MKYVVASAAAFFLAVSSASALPYVRVLGVTPDLLLIFLVSWAMIRGQGEAMVLVPIAGFLRDLVGSDPVGTSVLALAPVVPIAALRNLKVVETDFVPALAAVAGSTIAYFLVSMAVLTATGWDMPWLTALPHRMAPAIIVNMLFTVVVYLPIRWLSKATAAEPIKLGTTVRL